MREYLIANYHTHTIRCKHARGTEREYIEAAIAAGLKELGFADHAPCRFRGGHVSGIRMDMGEAKEYVETIRALAKEYEGKIRLRVGFEAEYLPDYFDEQIAFFDEIGIDYLIMGQHFLADEQDGPYTGSRTTDENMIKNYVDLVLRGADTGRFAYVAHPDLINYQGDEAVYEREITRLCEGLKERKIPLEINLLGILENKHYPAERFWKIAGRVGNQAILGIDVHWTEQIGDKASYQKAMEIVRRYGLDLLERLP